MPGSTHILSTPKFEIRPANEAAADLPGDLGSLTVAVRDTNGPVVRAAAVGDLGFSGRVSDQPSQITNPLAEVAPFLRNCDLVLGNLEGVLTDQPLESRCFAASAVAAKTLADSGIGVVHLANNHILDHGPDGFASTFSALERARIQGLGGGPDQRSARSLVRSDMGDLRMGWLGCGRTLLEQAEEGPGFWEFDEDELVARVEESRAEVDFLGVSIHIGYMYVDYPDPDLRRVARRLAEAGADLVVMHHPHVLQGMELFGRTLVCYSLGNLLLDWEEGEVSVPIMVREQREGAVFLFTVDREGVAASTILPTFIDDDLRVRWAVGDRGRRILERLERISRDLETDYTKEFEHQRAQRNTALTLKTLGEAARRRRWKQLVGLLTRTRPKHFRMLLRWLFSRPSSASTQ